VRYGALSWPEPEYPEPGLLTIAGVMLDTGQVQDMYFASGHNFSLNANWTS